jgi:hypothetical protein
VREDAERLNAIEGILNLNAGVKARP